MSDLVQRTGGVLVAAAVAVVIVAVAIVPFLNPFWVAFAQDRAQAEAWTGYTPDQLRTATDAILADLVLGPPDFDTTVDGEPVLNERERGHMADVRGVFMGLAVLALVSAVLIAFAAIRAADRRPLWRAARAGALGVLAGAAVVGIVGLLAFELAFEVFHRLFFAGGSYTFDPATERLVQLFPQQFWFETAMAVGVVIAALSLATVWLATRRLRSADARGATLARPSLETAR